MTPNRNPTTATRGKETNGSIEKTVEIRKVLYIPIIRNSPWAKLTIFITPKIIVSPKATRAKINPISMPELTICTANSIFFLTN